MSESGKKGTDAVATLEQIAAERARRDTANTPEPRGLFKTVEDVFRSVAHGATLGGSDEAAAFMSDLTGIGGTPGAAPGYEGELAAQRARDEEIPLATRISGEIAGALLNPLTRRNLPAKIPGWLNAVGLGTLFGGGYGFNTGEEGLGNRAASAGTTAAIGAGTGGLLYPVAKGVEWAVRQGWQALSKAMNPESAAVGQLAQAVRRDDMTPPTATGTGPPPPGRVDTRLSNLGPQAMIVDAGGQNVRGLARAAAGTPGVAANRASIVLNQRARGEASRIGSATKQGLGSSGDDFHAARDAFILDMEKRAAPLYQQAYAAYPELMTPALQRIVSGASGQKALREAADILENEVAAGRMPASVLAEVRAAAEGGKTVSLQVWDHIKRGLDSLLEKPSNRNALTGKLTGRGFSIDLVRRSLLKELDGVTGGVKGTYAQARKIYSGDAEAIHALDIGRKALNKDPELIARELAALSEAGKEAYRTGAARALMDIAEKTGDTASAANRLWNTARRREQFRAIFPDQETFQVFQRAMTREQRFNQSKNFVLGGSQTQPRQAGAADLGAAGSVGAMVGSSTPFLPGLVGAGLGRRVAERVKTAVFGDGSPMDEALSRMLFSRDAATNAQTIAKIRQTAQAQNLTDAQVGILARGTLLAMTEQEGRAFAR